MVNLNVTNLSVDKSGRVSFSGLSSGIDFQGVVDSIMAARRVPADLLETQVASNKDKVAALGDLRSLLTTVKESLKTLYGAVSVGNVSDTFESKEAFASASRVDGSTPSSAGNLIGVTVSNAAAVGSHSMEILQVAKAHKVSSDEFSSVSTSVGFSSGDAITIEGKTINFSSSDTLQDVRDRINNANKGATATGVSASIVSVTGSEHYLVLTKNTTGSDIAFAETSGTALQDLGIFNASSALKNQLQASQKAEFYADGLLDQTNTLYESDFQSAATVTPGTGGTLTFTADAGGGALGTVNYTSSDNLTSIAAAITANITGVSASVVTDGAGVRLQITGASAYSFTDSGSAVEDFGIDNKRRLIERASNTVDDLFAGVTVSVFQSEPGTVINLDIERNLSNIKTSITNFVESYNELRRFINDQRTLTEIADDDDPTVISGLLFNSAALEQADTALSAIIGSGVSGVNGQFSVLAQIGVDFIPLGSEEDPLDANTLEIDDTVLDEALLNNVEDIKRMFSFDLTASDPRITMLGFNGTTKYDAAGITLNIQPNAGTNLFQYSDQLDNAYWSTSAGSVSANAINAPDGNATADGLIGNTSNSTHYIETAAPLTVTAGESYTMSAYVKQGANDSARLQLAGANFPTDTYADFDLGTGTLRNQGNGVDAYSIESAGDGWYRISVTGTAAATGNATMQMHSLNGANATYAGDGSTVDTYFYGAQFEPAAATVTQIDSFTATNATVQAAGVQTDPDGGLSATEIIGDVTSGEHGLTNATAATVTSGSAYEFVTYLRAGDKPRAQLSLEGGVFAADTTVDVNLSTGAIVSTGAGADSANIENVGGGWYRVTLAATATANGAATTEILAVDASTGTTFSGDGSTQNTYAFDAKLVPSAAKAPGDHIATTSSAITGATASANIGGAADGSDDGSVVVANNVATIQSGNAEGLRLFFSGLDLTSAITVNYTVGIGAQMFFAIDDLLNEATGLVETEIESLEDTNAITEDRIGEILARLEIQRKSLLERFITMETAVATANRILETLGRQTDAMFQNSN